MHLASVPPTGAPPGPGPIVADWRAAAPGIVSWHDIDDAALAAALASGEVAALDQLYRRYRSACFAAAYALLREPAAADDVVHDAFLRAWRGAGAFHPARGTVRAWLLTIVRNMAVDALRSRQLAARPQPRLVHWASAPLLDEDVPSLVAMAIDAARLHAALRSLPPLQRDALELAFFSGLSHGEIAARTGVPLGTVKGRVRLGLRRLRQELGDLAPARSEPRRRTTSAA